jgi:hypothetical protein
MKKRAAEKLAAKSAPAEVTEPVEAPISETVDSTPAEVSVEETPATESTVETPTE